MPQLQLNRTTFHYIDKGQGEPVIFVHGNLGDFRNWELQIDAFAEKYRTISYSRRYHYPNPCRGNETDYSAILHASDLASFILEMNLESAHNLAFKSSMEHYNKIYRSEMTGFTSVGRENMSDSTPLDGAMYRPARYVRQFHYFVDRTKGWHYCHAQ